MSHHVIVMLNVVMLSFIMLSVIMLSVIMQCLQFLKLSTGRRGHLPTTASNEGEPRQRRQLSQRLQLYHPEQRHLGVLRGRV